MPRPPNIPLVGPPRIQVGRFDLALRRLLGIKQSGVVAEVDPRVSMQADLVAMRYADQLLPQGVTPWAVGFREAASVGNRPIWHLHNPSNSGLQLIVDRIAIQYAAAGAHAPAWFVTDFVPSVNPIQLVYRDVRSWVNSNKATPNTAPKLFMSQVAAATSYGTFIGAASFYTLKERSQMIAGGTGDYLDDSWPDLVLPPGTSIGIETGTTNVTTAVYAYGTWRPVEAVEAAIR